MLGIQTKPKLPGPVAPTLVWENKIDMTASVGVSANVRTDQMTIDTNFCLGLGGGSLLQFLTPKQLDMATGSAPTMGWTFMNELEGLCEVYRAEVTLHLYSR